MGLLGRHIYYNRYDMPAAKLYRDLYAMMKDKNHFVLTTNVDHQFWLAGFQDECILQPRETTGCSSANRHAIRSCMTMRRRSGGHAEETEGLQDSLLSGAQVSRVRRRHGSTSEVRR